MHGYDSLLVALIALAVALPVTLFRPGVRR
jgi:hypothetical protein